MSKMDTLVWVTKTVTIAAGAAAKHACTLRISMRYRSGTAAWLSYCASKGWHRYSDLATAAAVITTASVNQGWVFRMTRARDVSWKWAQSAESKQKMEQDAVMTAVVVATTKLRTVASLAKQ
jgi:hypothetical protein